MSITFGRFAETAEQEDPREKRLKMLKRQVLQKKMQAVRQGGEGITASYEPAGEIVQELFGNKKYPYGKATKKNPRGKRDQAELDRAQAYIKKHPNFGKKDVKEAKVDEKLPDYKRATARDKRYGNPHGSHELGGGIRKDRRADHEAKRGVKKEELTIEAKVEGGYISNVAKAQARNERRFGDKGSTEPTGRTGQGTSSAATMAIKRGEEHKARRGVKKEELTIEAKVDAGKSPETKEKDRNVRKFGVSHNVSGHGKLRRSLHKMNRGDKKIKGDKSAWTEMESVQHEGEMVEELSRRSKPSAKAKMAKLDAILQRREDRKVKEKEALKTEGWLGKKKKEEKKPEKAMDAGARLRRKKQRQEYAAKVSGSEDNVPDDIRDHVEHMDEDAGSTIGGAVLDTVVKDTGVAKEIGGIAKDAIRDKRNLLRKMRREKPLPDDDKKDVKEGVGRALGNAAKGAAGYAAQVAKGAIGSAVKGLNDPDHKPNAAEWTKNKPSSSSSSTGGASAAKTQADKANKARVDARKKAIQKIKDDRRERATTIMTAEKAAKKVKKEGEDKKFKADSEKPIVAEFVNNLWEASKKCSKCGKVYTGKSCSCCAE